MTPPPSNRRCSLLFGCAGTVWHRVGGGQALCGDSAPFVTPPRFRQPSVIRLALPTRAFLDERCIPSTCGAPRQDRAPVPLLTNYPTFCQQSSTPQRERTFPDVNSFYYRVASMGPANRPG